MPTVSPKEVRLLRSLVLVRKYQRPEKIGSIYLSDAWRQDNSRALWEIVKSSPGADEAMGMALKPDWICVTPANRGVYRSDITLDPVEEGKEPPTAWIIDAKEILQVFPWTEEDDDDEDN